MSSDLRKEKILDSLSHNHRVLVVEMSEELGVSNETIRRDLKELEAEGAVRRIHGGAIPVARTADAPITERIQQHAREKDQIAQIARGLIQDDSVIFLDTGTTTLALARRLEGFKKIRLYTNSLRIAQSASASFGVSVQMTPGRLRPIEQDLVGFDTIAYLQQFHFDAVFMGTAAVDDRYGFMDFEEDEARIRQSLLGRARRCVMLADSSKFGRVANVITARFEQVTTLVTNRALPEELGGAIRQSGLEVLHD